MLVAPGEGAKMAAPGGATVPQVDGSAAGLKRHTQPLGHGHGPGAAMQESRDCPGKTNWLGKEEEQTAALSVFDFS